MAHHLKNIKNILKPMSKLFTSLRKKESFDVISNRYIYKKQNHLFEYSRLQSIFISFD